MSFRTDFQNILFSDINGEEKENQLHQIAFDNVPKSLYRFRSFSEHELDSFLNNRFYLNFPSRFNDPYDSLPFCLDDNALFSYFGLEEPSVQKQELINESQDKIKVACFTGNITSHLMWAHYADAHKGFALEYDFKEAYIRITGKGKQKGNHGEGTINSDMPAYIFPVVYTNKRVDATKHMIALYSSKYNGLYNFPGSRVPIPFDLDYYFRIMLTKHKDWEYEDEWRVMSPHYDIDTIYVELKPKAVIYGSKMSQAYREVLGFIARKNRIVEKQAVIPNDCDEFVINIQEIK